MRRLLSIALLSGVGVTLYGQSVAPDAGPVIRAETRVVLVDAVAVDKKQNFVRDLSRKDFHIREDGKDQAVTSFSLESAGLSPDRTQNRYIAFFFDRTALDPAALFSAWQDVTRFLDGYANPDRYMAVIAGGQRTEILRNFTTNADELKRAVGLVRTTSNGAGAVPMPQATGGNHRIATASANSFARYPDALASLRSLMPSLAAIKGRKAVVVLSGRDSQPPGDFERELAATIDACNKANVAIYAVDIGSAASENLTPAAPSFGPGQRGVRPAAPAPAGSQNEQPFLRPLAEGTGGIWFKSASDLVGTLGGVAREQDSYYLLGYTPSAPDSKADSPEGRCHALTVTVDRPGVSVRARKSYCASQASGAAPAGSTRVDSTLPSSAKLVAKLQVPWFYAGPNIAQVDVALDVIPSALKFRKDKGGLHGEFDLAGAAYGPDGSVGAHFNDTVKVDFDTQHEADAFLSTPYRYTNQLEIAPGTYNFRMTLSADGKSLGKIETPLAIESWSGQTLAMSEIALSHDAHRATALISGLDESMLEGPKPLVSKGVEVTPAANTQFRPDEPVYFYFEVYARGAAASGLKISLRAFDLASGVTKFAPPPLDAASYVREGNPVIPLAMVIPANSLPAGNYRLVVSVSPDVGRAVDFEIR